MNTRRSIASRRPAGADRAVLALDVDRAVAAAGAVQVNPVP